MRTTDKPIPDDEWCTIVANVPLVSVDLVIEHDDGVLLGKRENEPAKNEWVVPGGTVFNLAVARSPLPQGSSEASE
jgi:colanic acid biosynthesis protein WcaH